jgi:hypothetical protein
MEKEIVCPNDLMRFKWRKKLDELIVAYHCWNDLETRHNFPAVCTPLRSRHTTSSRILKRISTGTIKSYGDSEADIGTKINENKERRRPTSGDAVTPSVETKT